eukprot:scpid3481/ scgid20486/ Sperm-associated antigen 17; Projection protein PF6 homolog
MSKKQKPGKGAAAAPAGPPAGWDTALLSAAVQEALSTFFSCAAPLDAEDGTALTDLLCTAVRDRKLRRRFQSISRQDIIKLATVGLDSLKEPRRPSQPQAAVEPTPSKPGGRASKTGRASKAPKQAAGDKPAFAEAVEYAQQQMTSKGAIDTEMEVRLVKFLFLYRKKEYMQKRQERKALYSARQRTVPDAAPAPAKGKGKGGKEKPPAGGKKSSMKESAGKASPAAAPPPPLKMYSDMKTRQEEEQDAVAADDEPEDGPDYYIVFTGFHESLHFFAELSKVGIHCDLLVELRKADNDEAAHLDSKNTLLDWESGGDRKRPATTKEETLNEEEQEERRNRLAQQKSTIDRFWQETRHTVNQSGSSDPLRDMTWNSLFNVADVKDLSEEAEAEFQKQVYDEYARIVFTVVEEKQLHKHYLNALAAAKVPRLTPAVHVAKPKQLLSSVYATEESDIFNTPTDVYRRLLNSVPVEFTSVPIIMHCMLEQVCHTLDTDSSRQERQSKMPPIEKDFESTFMTSLLDTMADNVPVNTTKSSYKDERDSSSSSGATSVYHGGDTATQRQEQLTVPTGFDMIAAEKAVQSLSPLRYLVTTPLRCPRDQDRIGARLQQIEATVGRGSFATRSSFLHALQQLCLEGLVPHMNKLLSHTVNAASTIWADPLASVAKLEDQEAALTGDLPMNDWCVSRFHPNTSALLQVLEDAYQQYRCCTVADLQSLQSRLVCFHDGNVSRSELLVPLSNKTVVKTPVQFSNFRTDFLEPLRERLTVEVKRAQAEKTVLVAQREEAAKKEAEERAAAEAAAAAAEAETSAAKGRKTPAKSRAASSQSGPGSATKAGKSASKSGAVLSPPDIPEAATEQEPELPLRKVFSGCDFGEDSIVQLMEDYTVLTADKVDSICIGEQCFEDGNQHYCVKVRSGTDVYRLHRIAAKEPSVPVASPEPHPTHQPPPADQNSEPAQAGEAADVEITIQDEPDKMADEFDALPKPKEASCLFSSFQAEINGLNIAGSWYPKGRPPSLDDKFAEQFKSVTDELESIPPTRAVESPVPDKANAQKGKKQQQMQAEIERLEAEQKANEERREQLIKDRHSILAAARNARLRPTFPQTSVCLSNGLHVAFSVQHLQPEQELSEKSLDEPGVICVHQRYVMPGTAGQERLEAACSMRADVEEARCVHGDGRVVVLKRNGDCDILFPDGSTIHGRIPPELTLPNEEEEEDEASFSGIQNRTLKRDWTWYSCGGMKSTWTSSASPASLSPADEDGTVKPASLYTQEMKVEKLTNPDSKEVSYLLPSKVQIVHKHGGKKMIAAFVDGSMITTSRDGTVRVECSGYLPVSIPSSRDRMHVRTANGMRLQCSHFGQFRVFAHTRGATVLCMDVKSSGSPVVTCGEHEEDALPPAVLHGDGEYLCSTVTGGRRVHVDQLGRVLDEKGEKERMLGESDASAMAAKRAARFFVVRDDGSGEEMLTRERLDKIVADANTSDSATQLQTSSSGSDAKVITTIQQSNLTASKTWLPELSQSVSPYGTLQHRLAVVQREPLAERTGNTKYNHHTGSMYGKSLRVGPVMVKPQAKASARPDYDGLSVQQYRQYLPLDDRARDTIVDAVRTSLPSYIEDEKQRLEGREQTVPEIRQPTKELQRLFDMYVKPPTPLSAAQVKTDYDQQYVVGGNKPADQNGDDESAYGQTSSDRAMQKSHLERRREELQEERAREAMNHRRWGTKEVPAYFQSLVGQHALQGLERELKGIEAETKPDSPGMEELSGRLAKTLHIHPAESTQPEPGDDGATVEGGCHQQLDERPLSQESLQSCSLGSGVDVHSSASVIDKQHVPSLLVGSISSLVGSCVRPDNPTPLTASMPDDSSTPTNHPFDVSIGRGDSASLSSLVPPHASTPMADAMDCDTPTNVPIIIADEEYGSSHSVDYGVRPHNPTPLKGVSVDGSQTVPSPIARAHPASVSMTAAGQGSMLTRTGDDPIYQGVSTPGGDPGGDSMVSCGTPPPSQLMTSKYMNAAGLPRNAPVPTPEVLKPTRDGAKRNEKYLATDGSIHRRMHTSSVQAAAAKLSSSGHTEVDIVSKLHTFVVQPSSLDFGRLQEGCTYHLSFSLINTGVDSGRFRIKQPPPATGLAALYTTDLVAAGMKVNVVMEIAAMAVGIIAANGLGKVTHNLEIITEVAILTLPITATVIPLAGDAETTHLEQRKQQTLKAKPASNVTLASDRPRSRDGLGRLRKPH